MNDRAVGISWLILFYSVSASFVEVSLPMSAVAPILSKQVGGNADSRGSCSKLCHSDSSCYGYILSDPGEDFVCRYLTFPLCILHERLYDGQKNDHPESVQRVAIKSTRHLDASHDALSYPEFAPVFRTGFQTEFVERQIFSILGKKYVRTVLTDFIRDDWDNADVAEGKNLHFSNEIECLTLCKESQNLFGLPCGIALESIITSSDKAIAFCRIFPYSALSSLKTLKTVDQTGRDNYEISHKTIIAPNTQVRNDVCRKKWNHLRVVGGKMTDSISPPSELIKRHELSPRPTNRSDDNSVDENSSKTNGTEDLSSQSVVASIEKPSFWSRFIFCAVIPASVIVIAVFTSAIACSYSKQKLNRQVAQFWRWQQAGIPSDDFRPADDARDLIF